MLNKTFIPGNILTANELNDIVDGLNNVDVRIGEQFQCCCDEEIKPVLLSHIHNGDIHTPIQDIIDLIERKIQTALEGWSGPVIPDNPTDLTDYVNYRALDTRLAEYWKKADIQSELDNYVIKDVFTNEVKNIYDKINGIVIPDNFPSYSDIEDLENRLKQLANEINKKIEGKDIADFVTSSYTEGRYVKQVEFADYKKDVENKYALKNDLDSYAKIQSLEDAIQNSKVTLDQNSISGYDTIRIGILRQGSQTIGSLYAPIIKSEGGEDNPIGPNDPVNTVQEHSVTLFSSSPYNTIVEALRGSDGKLTKGSWDFEYKVFDNPNPAILKLESSSLTAPIYFTTRIFYSDDTPTYWSTPALFLNKESFVQNKYIQIFARADADGNCPALNRTGGSYNFDTKVFTSPSSNWKDSLKSFNIATDKIYYSWRTFYSDNTTTEWHDPIPLITSEQLKEEISSVYSQSRGVSIYKISSTKPERPIYRSIDSVTYTDNMNFTLPGGSWYHTISDAMKNWYETNNNTEYKVWVSYNNFILTYENNVLKSTENTGWTDPVEYIDIDSLLDEAEKVAQDKANEALKSAKDALDTAKATLNGRIDNLDGHYASILGANGETVQAAISGLVTMYSWKEFSSQEITDHKPILTQIDWSDPNFIKDTPDFSVTIQEIIDQIKALSGIKYVNKYIKFRKDGVTKYFAYTAESLAIINQVAAIGSELDTVKNTITSDQFKVDVVKASLDNTEVKTSMIDAVAGDISLVVAEGKNGDVVSKAVFNLALKNNISQAQLSADRIVLDGEVIAAAIAINDLNVANKTYLQKDGTVLMGQGSNGASAFNPDGTGKIAGGLIQWGPSKNIPGAYLGNTETFVLQTKGHIEAYSGHIGYDPTGNNAGWTIGNAYGIPALIAKDSENNELLLSTNYLASHTKNDYDYSWMLNSDGTARFGKTDGDNIVLNEGNISITGEINAKSGNIGGWNVGEIIDYSKEDADSCPAIYSESGNDSIVMFPHTIYSMNGVKPRWMLNRDGSGILANGHITWEPNGSASFAGNVTADSLTLGSGSFAYNPTSLMQIPRLVANKHQEYFVLTGSNTIGTKPDVPVKYMNRNGEIIMDSLKNLTFSSNTLYWFISDGASTPRWNIVKIPLANTDSVMNYVSNSSAVSVTFNVTGTTYKQVMCTVKNNTDYTQWVKAFKNGSLTIYSASTNEPDHTENISGGFEGVLEPQETRVTYISQPYQSSQYTINVTGIEYSSRITAQL